LVLQNQIANKKGQVLVIRTCPLIK